MKVSDSKNVSQVNKKKKSSSSSKASGVSFDSLVDAARGVGAVDAADDVHDATSGPSAGKGRMDVPEDAQGRGHYMLDQLEELERDILSGHQTGAIAKLKNALETQAVDRDQLPPRLKEILDEIEMRASVEVAKMEEAMTQAKTDEDD